MNDRRIEVLDLYRRHRVSDQTDFYAQAATRLESARLWAVTTSSVLLVLAALFGALGAADTTRRPAWAFAAAASSAVATALSAYEAASGFERLGRRYGETRDALALVDVNGPLPADLEGLASEAERDQAVSEFVATTERLLRLEVDAWSQQSVAETPDVLRDPSV
jgi:predicted component of type VI protein secretion system